MALRKARVSSTEITERLDHLGLISAAFDELGFEKRFNERIGSKDPRREIQPGLAIKAMILNGLGFSNRRLYLTPQFFEVVATSRLLGEGVMAQQINEHTLGKALDEIAEYDESKLFMEVAFEACLDHGLLGDTYYGDTTSFLSHGKHDGDEGPDVIQLVPGYSKDHRPDLPQAILGMAITGAANTPVMMIARDGNASDTNTLAEIRQRIHAFGQQLRLNKDMMHVGDAAMYAPEKLKQYPHILWITRVPETNKESKKLLGMPDEAFVWQQDGNGYCYAEVESNYGDIKQRWLLIFSQQKYDRKKKSFQRQLKKQKEKLDKECGHLSNQVFNCREDAEKAVVKLQKKHEFFVLNPTISPIEGYVSKGRPSKGMATEIKGWQIDCKPTELKDAIAQHISKNGRFILATNNLDIAKLPTEKILRTYKEQQVIERGFRFLKDPWFMADTFFLKSRKRIAALMMIMTLCLFVYNYAQYKLRKKLEECRETIPNQLSRPTKTPTMRWVFQLMEGVSVNNYLDAEGEVYDVVITNLNTLRQKIIRLFDFNAMEIYGLA